MLTELLDTWKSSEYFETLSREKVQEFSSSISILPGVTLSGELVPMTYVTRFRLGEFELLKRLKIDLSQILHGEQEYHFTADLSIGDEIRYQTRLIHREEKKRPQGSLTVYTFETCVFKMSREVVRSKTTVLLKEKVS